LRARYYDPTTGRFNRLDPFFGNQFDPQSFHKYLYTHADPVNGIDPSGEIPVLAIYALIGAAIGGGFGYYQHGWEGALWGAVAGAASGASIGFLPAITSTTSLGTIIRIGILGGTIGGGIQGSIYGFTTSYFINDKGFGEALYDGIYDGIYGVLFGSTLGGAIPGGGYLLGKTVLTAGSLITRNLPAMKATALEYIMAANILVRQNSMAFSQVAKVKPVVRYVINPNNNTVKGKLGEWAGDLFMDLNGYTHLGDGLFDGIHGIDSIFLNPNTRRLVIHESKYRTQWSAASNPEELLGYGYGHKQMSDGWIGAVARKIGDKLPELRDRIYSVVGTPECEKTMSVVTKDGYMFLYQWKDNVWKLIQ
jgi:hypothetical protein